MIKTLLTSFLAILSTLCCAQGITIKRGNSHKTFKQNSTFKIYQKIITADLENQCCEVVECIGTITGLSPDSLTLRLKSYSSKKNVFDSKVENELYSLPETMTATISKKDIDYLQRYKSYKSMKRKENLIPLGGLLLTTGLVTGINTFFVKDKKGKNALLLSGGIQIGAGITFLLAGASRKYHFQGDHKICTFQ